MNRRIERRRRKDWGATKKIGALWASCRAPKVAERRVDRASLGPLTLLAVGALSGCVSSREYRALRAEVMVEADAHRRTAGSLERAYRELESTRARLLGFERQVQSGQADLAEATLEADVVGRERDETNALISQLRADLSRVGSHLEAFSSENKELRDELDDARARLAALADAEGAVKERALVLRDLTLALGERSEDGALELLLSEGSPAVRIPLARALSDEGKTLSADGSEVVTAVARVAGAGTNRRVVLRETRGRHDDPRGSAEARLKPLVSALVERGVRADRISIDRALAPGLAPGASGSTAPSEAPGSGAPEAASIEIAVVVDSPVVPDMAPQGAAAEPSQPTP